MAGEGCSGGVTSGRGAEPEACVGDDEVDDGAGMAAAEAAAAAAAAATVTEAVESAALADGGITATLTAGGTPALPAAPANASTLRGLLACVTEVADDADVLPMGAAGRDMPLSWDAEGRPDPYAHSHTHIHTHTHTVKDHEV